jgi:hypothetical protein
MRWQSERIAASRAGRCRLLGRDTETVTHLLRRHRGPGLAGYRAQLKQPVDPELLERIAAWTSSVGPSGA